MNHLAYEGKQASSARKSLKGGVVYFLPKLKVQLPRAAEAVRSWEKLEGQTEREPLCLSLSGIVVEELGQKSFFVRWTTYSQLRNPAKRGLEVSRGSRRLQGRYCCGAKVQPPLRGLGARYNTKWSSSLGVEVQEPQLVQF